jgi:predicted phage tail protein
VKPWEELLAGALACLFLGFVLGRWAAPTKTVTQVHETVRTVTDTAAQAHAAVLQAQIDDLKRSQHREVITVVRANGTKIRREVSDSKSETTHESLHVLSADSMSTVHAESVHEVVRTVTVERKAPEWFAGPLVVASTSGISAGVLVGRHIAGPIAVGLSASVPVNQPVSIPAVGLSVTVSF